MPADLGELGGDPELVGLVGVGDRDAVRPEGGEAVEQLAGGVDAERGRHGDVHRIELQRAQLSGQRLHRGRVARGGGGRVDHHQATIATVLDGWGRLGASGGAHHPHVLALEQLLEIATPVVAAERHHARGERRALGVRRGQRGRAARLAGATGADEGYRGP